MACPSENAIQLFATAGPNATALSAYERRSIEAHLATCPSCRVVVSELARSEEPADLARTQEVIAPLVSIFSVGEVLADRYRIVRFLAEGGMGEVYEAEDTELAVRVALKTVRPALARDARALARFKREVNLARSVTHPNVCRIFDLGIHVRTDSDERVPFFTMEFLDGETLSARLRRGPLSLAEALPIISDIAAALDAAHAASIIHRDFKSPNVILCVTSNGLRAKVTDFGLARDEALPQSDKLSSELEVLGSPAYIAPEQLTGESITSAVDVYAFGVVMFEMVTGRLPFVGTTPLLTAMLRMQETPPSVRSLVRTIPLSWDHVIARCLSRRPEARFRSASDAVHALALVATARPTRRWMAPLVLVVACALAAVAWISAEKPAVVEKAPSARVVGERHVDVAQRESSTGVVVIRSDPPGARITIDDDDAGFTPAIKSLVLPHEISLSLDGYVPIREVITHAGEVLVPLTRRHVTKSRIMPPIPITAPIAKPIPTREGLD